MKIEVLGVGCAKCSKLFKFTEEAIEKAGVDVQLEKVTALSEIAKYGVMSTPALVIDGNVKVSGKVPTVDEIASWLVSD